jgi:hypothetical protein
MQPLRQDSNFQALSLLYWKLLLLLLSVWLGHLIAWTVKFGKTARYLYNCKETFTTISVSLNLSLGKWRRQKFFDCVFKRKAIQPLFRHKTILYNFFMAQQPIVGHGLLIVETSRSNSRRTTFSGTPLYEWSARCRDLYLTTHNIHKTDIHVPSGIRTRNTSKRAAAFFFYWSGGHRDQHAVCYLTLIYGWFQSFAPV